jgi:hypothetical protein
MATRFHSSSDGPPPACRTVPNFPGALLRGIQARLGVSPNVALRVAALYGDIEWRAAGAPQLRYSASDYARRMGFHRHTVHTDFALLVAIGAVSVSYDQQHHPIVRLHGLTKALPPADAGIDEGDSPLSIPTPTPVDFIDTPLSFPSTSPCRSDRHPPVDALASPLSKPSTAIEKTSKTQKKEDRKKKRGKPARPSPEPDQTAEQPGSLQSPGGGRSRAKGSGAEPQEPIGSPEPQAAALLDRLLATFRDAAPHEWPAPERLTPSRGRRSRLLQALEHAGSAEALERRLRAALGAVPPWFRHTYPVRPDGSRRPAYQFFDLLLRASAAERECGVEAWHLFAWSEAGGGLSAQASSAIPSPETDLQRAQRLFAWDSGRWLSIGIEALALSSEEKQRLASLLEAQGQGIAGTAAHQFGSGSPALSLQEPQPAHGPP